jgi:hypothetical protein
MEVDKLKIFLNYNVEKNRTNGCCNLETLGSISFNLTLIFLLKKKLIRYNFGTTRKILETCDSVNGGVEELQVVVVSPLDAELVKLTAGLDEGHATILEDGARCIQVGIATLGRIHAAMILASESNNKTEQKV